MVIFLVFIGVTPSFGMETQAPWLTPPATLSRIILQAIEKRSSVRSRGKAALAQENLAIAQICGYLPQITVNQNVRKINLPVTDHNQATIQVTQLLFDLAGPLERYRIAQKDVAIAYLEQDLQRDNVRFQMEQSLLNHWDVHKRQRAFEKLRLSANKQFSKAQDQNTVGLLGLFDWMQQKAIFSQNIAAVMSYEDDKHISQYQLAKAMSQNIPKEALDDAPLQEFVEQSIFNAQKYSLDFFLTLAQQHRKELAIKDQEIEQQEDYEKFYARSYIPTVAFYANIDHDGIFKNILNAASEPRRLTTIWQAGLTFSWGFDGLANVFRSRAAEESVAQKVLEKRSTWSDIRLEVQTTHAQTQKLLKQLDAATEQYKSSQTEFDLKELQFKVGQLSPDDYVTAQYTWQAAQDTLRNAKVELAIKYRELVFRSGYPDNAETEKCLSCSIKTIESCL